ncbi:MAG: HIT family protein [Nanoarchaeota archaeon]
MGNDDVVRTCRKPNLFLEWYQEGSQIVYDGADVVVFLSSVAVVKGHMLVVPKKKYTSVFDVPEHVRHELYDVAVMMAERAQQRMGCKAVQIVQNEQFWKMEPESRWHVDHIHIHVQPRFSSEEVGLVLHRFELTDEDVECYRELLS